MTSTLVYTVRPAPLHEAKPGSRVEHDGTVYKVFRTVRVVRPGGYVLLGVARLPNGGWCDESVALYYANRTATVSLVVGGEVPHAS